VSAGSTITTPLLSLGTTHTKKQTQTTEPNQRRKKDYPQTIFGTSQRARNLQVKAVATSEAAEKLIALGYEFHYRTSDGVDLFRKKVIGLD
jgi:hypothetical protein